MGGFFNLDGGFAKFGNMLADVIILSFIWFLFSIPIFTIGASTTALFFVTTRRISNKEGYLFKDFFTSFKREFKQATVAWVFILIVGGVLAFNILNINLIFDILPNSAIIKTIYSSIQLCLFIELCFFTIFVFPLLSRFNFTLKSLFVNAFFMSNKHFLTTLLCFAISLTILYLIYISNLLVIFVAIGLYAFSTSFFIMKVFKKHRPEIDEEDFSLKDI